MTKESKLVDVLDEDKPIANQKFVCVSFLSPENITILAILLLSFCLLTKLCHFFIKYLLILQIIKNSATFCTRHHLYGVHSLLSSW